MECVKNTPLTNTTSKIIIKHGLAVHFDNLLDAEDHMCLNRMPNDNDTVTKIKDFAISRYGILTIPFLTKHSKLTKNCLSIGSPCVGTKTCVPCFIQIIGGNTATIPRRQRQRFLKTMLHISTCSMSLLKE